MRQMNNDVNSKEGRRFLQRVGRKIELQKRMRQTSEAKQAAKASDDLAKRIFESIAEAESIEDLIHYEMVLQTLDQLSAQNQHDQSSIENAQREYRQLSETVTQMRENPDEYFRANVAFRDTGGDFRKLPRGRIQHIHANIARLQNRATFAADDERGVWEARIKLAEKTMEMLRAMHKKLAKEHESAISQKSN